MARNAATISTASVAPIAECDIRRHKWTIEQYHRMAEVGILDSDARVELIEGEIVDKVSPQGTPHTFSLRKTSSVLDIAFGEQFDVRYQLPVTLADLNEPEPDVAVARGSFHEYAERHPGADDLVLVVEISDTTLATDRSRKARVYATASIPEYWIVNLVDRRLEVYREPVPGIGYRTTTLYAPTDSLSPLGAPAATVSVADLLP